MTAGNCGILFEHVLTWSTVHSGLRKETMSKSIKAQTAKLLHISYAKHQHLSTVKLYFATLDEEDLI